MSVREGQRIKLTKDVDYFPHFHLRAGATGTVSMVNASRGKAAVKMDDPVEGCEHWDNEVFFNLRDTDEREDTWATLEDVSQPIQGSKDA